MSSLTGYARGLAQSTVMAANNDLSKIQRFRNWLSIQAALDNKLVFAKHYL